MPIENERKLLLDCSKSSLLLADLRKHPDIELMDITQGYLSAGNRIRHVAYHKMSCEDKYIFTYKVKVMGSIVEVECPISTHDFQKLFLICKPLIIKTRAKVVCGLYTWDIDFLRKPKSGDIYLAMAEVEMPEFEHEVPATLDLLEPYALKWIDQGDKRFNNRNLGNPKKAAKAQQEVLNGKAQTK